MSDQLLRDERQVQGNVFFIMPFGKKRLSNDEWFDFDEFYTEELAPAVKAYEMTPVRADSIYGPQTVMAPIWRGVQQAEVVVVDFTAKSANVAFEYALAQVIGKKMIFLTQDPEDIPTDVRGLRYIRYSSNFADVKRMRTELAQQLPAICEEPSVEMALVPMTPGGSEPAPGTILTVSPEFVVVQVDDGRKGVLGNADVDYSRLIRDMTRRFKVGDRVDGAFDRGKYTLLAGSDPWPTIKAAYPPGTEYTGTVRSVVDKVGAFVSVSEGVNGLIPASSMPQGVCLARQMSVQVTVTKLDVKNRQIGLRLLEADCSSITTIADVPSVGSRFDAEVIKAVPEQEERGGYILVELPDHGRALLHCTKMSPLLRADLNRGDVEARTNEMEGEILTVEVLHAAAGTGKITVREIPDEEEQQAAA